MKFYNKKQLVTVSLVCALLASVGGCSINTGVQGPITAIDPTETQAYSDGYTLNLGASVALINEAGSADAYCSAIVALHPEYTAEESQNYILGCLEAVPDAVLVDPTPTEESKPSDDLTGDLLTRLQNSGGAYWSEDAFSLSSDLAVGFTTDYLSEGCTLWVFDSQDSAQSTYNYGFFDTFSDYQLSVGTDHDGNGVVAMFMDSSSVCAGDMLYALDWSNF